MEDLLTQYGSDFSYLTMAGIGSALLTQFLKNKFASLNPRYLAAGLCALAGVIYALGQTFVPIEVLQKLSAFGTLAFGMATGLYKLQK